MYISSKYIPAIKNENTNNISMPFKCIVKFWLPQIYVTIQWERTFDEHILVGQQVKFKSNANTRLI